MALVVKSQIKDVAGEFNVAGDVAPELEKHVEQIIKKACERAKANGRRTIMAKDL